MTYVFYALALLSAGFVAWNLIPAGFKKLRDFNENLPTFQSLFGRNGDAVLIATGFVELFGSFSLVVAIVIGSELVPVFAAAVAFVMFAAATVHVIAWKNSPKQPLILFAATLLALTFAYGVQKTEAPATEIQSIVADSVAVDTTFVDTVTVDTLTR